MFSKSLSQIGESDIQALVDNEQKESVALEFKQEISGSDREKKEIPKDISAIANTEGGFVIFGIRENDGKAAEVVGTPKLIGNQPVEEWVESVLISNVRPRLTVKPKIIPVATNDNNVVLVLQIPQSPRRPHMVTVDGKNAYYKRHNYQTSYADEHEVRSMFLESKTSIDEMKEFLKSRNLDDTKNENFTLTPLSEEIKETFSRITGVPEDYKGKPFILFASCPRYLEERINIASADFREWLNQRDHIDLFGFNIDFLDYNKQITSDSIRSVKERYHGKEGKRIPIRYVEVFRNGYVENGLSTELIWRNNRHNEEKDLGLFFHISYFTAAFWLYMKFIKDLYAKLDYFDEINIIVALSDINGLTLHGFGNKSKDVKWLNPYDFLYGSDRIPTSRQKNFRFEKSIVLSDIGDDEIEKIVKDVVVRVSNAFGETIAKCFDDDGNFDKNQLNGFGRVSHG